MPYYRQPDLQGQGAYNPNMKGPDFGQWGREIIGGFIEKKRYEQEQEQLKHKMKLAEALERKKLGLDEERLNLDRMKMVATSMKEPTEKDFQARISSLESIGIPRDKATRLVLLPQNKETMSAYEMKKRDLDELKSTGRITEGQYVKSLYDIAPTEEPEGATPTAKLGVRVKNISSVKETFMNFMQNPKELEATMKNSELMASARSVGIHLDLPVKYSIVKQHQLTGVATKDEDEYAQKVEETSQWLENHQEITKPSDISPVLWGKIDMETATKVLSRRKDKGVFPRWLIDSNK